MYETHALESIGGRFEDTFKVTDMRNLKLVN